MACMCMEVSHVHLGLKRHVSKLAWTLSDLFSIRSLSLSDLFSITVQLAMAARRAPARSCVLISGMVMYVGLQSTLPCISPLALLTRRCATSPS